MVFNPYDYLQKSENFEEFPLISFHKIDYFVGFLPYITPTPRYPFFDLDLKKTQLDHNLTIFGQIGTKPPIVVVVQSQMVFV